MMIASPKGPSGSEWLPRRAGLLYTPGTPAPTSPWGLKNRQPFFWPHDPSKWLQFPADPHQLCVWVFFLQSCRFFSLKMPSQRGQPQPHCILALRGHPEDHPAWLQDTGVAGRSCLSAQGAPPAPLPHVTPHKWLGKLKPGTGKGDCSHKAYEMQSQQTLGQLKLGRWKCDTSPHGARSSLQSQQSPWSWHTNLPTNMSKTKPENDQVKLPGMKP